MKWRRTAGALMAAMVLAAGCSGAMTEKKSLYDRLGGKPAIQAVVDDFVGNVAADTRINRRFASTDIPHLKASLVDQICAGTRGPCTYKGADMKAVHRGMKVSVSQFNALAEDLQIAMDKQNVPYWTQNRLIALLAPMERDIVTR